MLIKKNKGNTMPITLIIMIVVSIIALGITYIVAQTSSTRNRKSNNELNYIVLENTAYDIINEAFEYFKINETLVGFENSMIENLSISSDTLAFTIKKNNIDKVLNVKVQYNNSGYNVLKWGDS